MMPKREIEQLFLRSFAAAADHHGWKAIRDVCDGCRLLDHTPHSVCDEPDLKTQLRAIIGRLIDITPRGDVIDNFIWKVDTKICTTGDALELFKKTDPFEKLRHCKRMQRELIGIMAYVPDSDSDSD